MGNYDGGLVNTGFIFEGYVDNYNCPSKDFSLDGGQAIIATRNYHRYSVSGKKIYEFAVIPNMGFLGSPDLLVKNCELKLSACTYVNSQHEIFSLSTEQGKSIINIL